MRLALAALALLLAATACGHATVRAGRGQPVGVGFDAAVTTTTAQRPAPENGPCVPTSQTTSPLGCHATTTQRAGRDYRRPVNKFVNAARSAEDVWACIRRLESGGNYAENTGNSHYGAYQFAQRTWDSMHTGYARADLAPPAVQDDAARRLQARSGWGQWSTARRCGV